MDNNYKIHLFMPTETIHAVIRKYNNYVSNPKIVEMLMNRFNELNSGIGVIHPGQQAKIPLLSEEESKKI